MQCADAPIFSFLTPKIPIYAFLNAVSLMQPAKRRKVVRAFVHFRREVDDVERGVCRWLRGVDQTAEIHFYRGRIGIFLSVCCLLHLRLPLLAKHSSAHL
jgi:hypothetical protein